MTDRHVTIEDLRRILIEGAGAEEGVDLDADILDERFADLGYDSIAVLETASRIEQEFKISLDDEAVASAQTPRQLLKLVNGD